MSKDHSESFKPGIYENAIGQKRRLIHADLKGRHKVWWEHVPPRKSSGFVRISASLREACPELWDRIEYVWEMYPEGWLKWLARGRGKRR